MKYIFLLSRVGAFSIDYLVYFLISSFFVKYGVFGYIISFGFFFLYRFLTTAYFGATIGMMALKLKLSGYGFSACLKREIFRFASALFYIGYIYAIFNPSSRTLHDIASDTFVEYSGNKELPKEKTGYFQKIAVTLLVISSIRWLSYVLINDIGLIGLRRVYVSDEYYQSFEGDKLTSISQDELYAKTLGRRYTTFIDIGGKPSLIRISNKLKYTEIYKLNLSNPKIVGEYLYKVDMPIQFICSGNFSGKREFCGVSPQNDVILVNQSGDIYARGKSDIISILTIKCGDMDMDGSDEVVILGRGGELEVYKFAGGVLNKVYGGRFGEDVIPETFYIDKGIAIVSKNDDRRIVYFYDYKDSKFTFKEKKYFDINGVTGISKMGDMLITSHVFRNAMTFKRGSIQRLEAYKEGEKIKKIYNFGGRPGRRYAYMVRSLESVFDIDGDGREEIILKAVGRDDVMGQGYVVEIYKFNNSALWINRIFSKLEDILYY